MVDLGRSASRRAGRPTDQAPAGLGDTATIPSAEESIRLLIDNAYRSGLDLCETAKQAESRGQVCYTPVDAVLLGNQLIACATLLRELTASGTEAQRAETVELGSVHDGPTAESGDAQTPSVSPKGSSQ